MLAIGEADRTARRRKDLGWIAFEPGVVSLTPSGAVKGAGFKTIQAKHAGDIVMIPQVIERGQISIEEPRVGRRSYILNHKGYRVAIRKQFFETHQTWVVTAYEKVE
ncbi:MAG: hypothetical protein F6K42_27800 [Leptolyngbya sp. SIO1D8]|nr:hypothetical protein [Leptolyngbya sp. SIO1D8]